MAITMAAIIFLNFHATPIIRLLIRIISDIAAYYNYLLLTQKISAIWLAENSDINPIFHISYVKYDRVSFLGVW